MADAGSPESARVRRASEHRKAERIARISTTLLLFAILAMVNYLAFRHYKRFDWTSQGIYTLSPKTQAVLRELNKDLDVYLFLSRGESSFLSTEELLKRYAAASSYVHLHYVDPDREQAQFSLLAQRFGVSAGVLQNGEARADVAAIVALSDERAGVALSDEGVSAEPSDQSSPVSDKTAEKPVPKNWHINRDDLVGSEFTSADSGLSPGVEEVKLKGEQALTGAIVQVTSGRATELCVTQGHGEWPLEEGEERSLSGLKQGLHHDNFNWRPLDTLGQTEIPSSCDAVLVVGPLRAFSDAEAKLLLDYVRAGGNALLALDPVIERDHIASTGFEAGLRELGIRVDPALIIEKSREHLVTRNPAEFMLTEFGDHDTTRILQHAARVFVTLARSITPISDGGDVQILMSSSDQAFGKTDLRDLVPDKEPEREAADIAGPVSLGVAKQLSSAKPRSGARGGRLVVLGDSDFMRDSFLHVAEFANFHVASALVGWVSERPALIEIPPKTIKSGNIVFSQEDLWALFFRVAVLMPLAALVLGVGVWLNRRA